ncbi:malto-oligosyltrehalose trehalohydrolase [Kibdelosporangium phytohabitans]|uniref:Malto-oligosyltrehalose trehalohydrolase n=1 Tax=Kibdelosporangium phytohabitans TaxID=860235 RepID=A0A0N7F3A6_9PSEU|nr:malto-oligosyltrehalose trehalohydrolase [Kibdelosporangium phytohabitans]ALG08095.1 malto-oligosyltrehalose trehalohydrolase [Kibdelosporangium phytohabitans]MBE1470929.1 maltooligosyltrehalose trehalohydrolase [Kibdelosporangium phytohabitans]
MTFSVWAPGKSRVRVRVDGEFHPMTEESGGWWRAGVTGTDYSFFVDDDETPLPDPRSSRQPEGVFGPSRVYDHSAFSWGDHAWTGRALPGSVLYELHIGTFTPEGTFDSASAKLDHLVDLGVDFVEVMPVNSFDGPVGWGYDGVLWGAVHEPYGGPDGFKRFVDAAHARGLGVVLDVVYNHMGPSGAFLDRFGPYFAGRNLWGPALNVTGAGSDEVRRYVLDNALMWFRDFHVDALRLDAVHAILDTRATHLLEEMAQEVDALSAGLRRPLSLIAESDLNDPRHVTPRAAGGYGLAAQWCDDLHHALHVFLTGETHGYYKDFGAPNALKTALENAFFHAGTWSSFRDRTHGRPVDKAVTPGHRFLCFLQNHDQIGNRAQGDRMSATVSPGVLLCGAAIMFCSPYTPMVFMGEEWAASTPWQFFASFPDPELAEAVRTGRRREFAEHGWGESEVPDPMDPATAVRSRLDWSEVDQSAHASVLDTYKALIALRRKHPELSDPRLDAFSVEQDDRVVVLHRGRIQLVCNLGATDVTRPAGEVLLASPGVADLVVPPENFAIIRR